jgi:hypothetical protein
MSTRPAGQYNPDSPRLSTRGRLSTRVHAPAEFETDYYFRTVPSQLAGTQTTGTT